MCFVIQILTLNKVMTTVSCCHPKKWPLQSIKVPHWYPIGTRHLPQPPGSGRCPLGHSSAFISRACPYVRPVLVGASWGLGVGGMGQVGSSHESMAMNQSLAWFVGDNLNRKPCFFFNHEIDRGFRLKFSHHPILWFRDLKWRYY